MALDKQDIKSINLSISLAQQHENNHKCTMKIISISTIRYQRNTQVALHNNNHVLKLHKNTLQYIITTKYPLTSTEM